MVASIALRYVSLLLSLTTSCFLVVFLLFFVACQRCGSGVATSVPARQDSPSFCRLGFWGSEGEWNTEFWEICEDRGWKDSAEV